MSTKVAINGFGRIGRLLARHLKARAGFDLVAINDLTSPDMLGYLFGHDSVHGPYKGTVEVDGSDIVIDGDRMQVFAEREPGKLPWSDLGPEMEATSGSSLKRRCRQRQPASWVPSYSRKPWNDGRTLDCDPTTGSSQTKTPCRKADSGT